MQPKHRKQTMAYFVKPTEKDFKKNPSFKGMKYENIYPPEDWICDTCGKPIVGDDRYFMVLTDAQVKSEGKPAFRHILCDKDFTRS